MLAAVRKNCCRIGFPIWYRDEARMLPAPEDVAGDPERCTEAVERAEELDEKKSVRIDESRFTVRMVVAPDKIHVTGTVAGVGSCRYEP